MDGLFGIPSINDLSAGAGNRADTKYYWGNSSGAGMTWNTWTKPPNKDFLCIQAIGGGGGGGGGCGGLDATAKGGGGGGGSAAYTMVVYPMQFLPDTLYLQVGNGGAGGAGGTTAAGSAGTAGGTTRISVYVSTVTGPANNLVASAGGGGAAGGGSTTAGGTVGAAGSVATQATAPFSCFAMIQNFHIGIAGSSGGAQTGGNGTTLASPGTLWSILNGGTGGGGSQSGTSGDGGIAQLGSFDPSNTNFFAPKDSGSGPGNGGDSFRYFQWNSGIAIPAQGGGGSALTTGGRGGNGGCKTPGCGGGGGGAGLTTGGRGGTGAPGLVIMTAF